MENLRTELVKVEGADGPEEFVLQEKDHGDIVVYDIYHKGRYLMTLANDGSILYMNFDAPDVDKELFKLPNLYPFIEKIASL